MHIISRKKLVEAGLLHSSLDEPLDIWYRAAKRAYWKNLVEVRLAFPSADGVGKYTVFNIKGNAYRLIVEINYLKGTVYIRHILTHAEYSKEGWKQL